MAGRFLGSVKYRVVLCLVIYLTLKISIKVHKGKERIDLNTFVASRDASLVNIAKLSSNAKVC